jgi:hypothetical protein
VHPLEPFNRVEIIGPEHSPTFGLVVEFALAK